MIQGVFYLKIFMHINDWSHRAEHDCQTQLSFSDYWIGAELQWWFWGRRDYVSLPLTTPSSHVQGKIIQAIQTACCYSTKCLSPDTIFFIFLKVLVLPFIKKVCFCSLIPLFVKKEEKKLQLFKLPRELDLEKLDSNFHWLDKISALSG